MNYKVALIGDKGVGKTSFLNFYRPEGDVLTYDSDLGEVRFEVSDNNECISQSYDVVIVMFEAAKPNIDRLYTIVKFAKEITPSAKIILCGTKSDLEFVRQDFRNNGYFYKAKIVSKDFEFSIKNADTGDNNIFKQIAQMFTPEIKFIETFKVVMYGVNNVGKTALSERYGVKDNVLIVETNYGIVKLKLECGIYLRSCKGDAAMVVYDLNNNSSANDAWRWFNYIANNISNKILICGNKADLEPAKYDHGQIDNFIEGHKYRAYIKTSIKDGYENPFEKVAQFLLEKDDLRFIKPKLRVAVIGDRYSGKTSLINKYKSDFEVVESPKLLSGFDGVLVVFSYVMFDTKNVDIQIDQVKMCSPKAKIIVCGHKADITLGCSGVDEVVKRQKVGFCLTSTVKEFSNPFEILARKMSQTEEVKVEEPKPFETKSFNQALPGGITMKTTLEFFRDEI